VKVGWVDSLAVGTGEADEVGVLGPEVKVEAEVGGMVAVAKVLAGKREVVEEVTQLSKTAGVEGAAPWLVALVAVGVEVVGVVKAVAGVVVSEAAMKVVAVARTAGMVVRAEAGEIVSVVVGTVLDEGLPAAVRTALLTAVATDAGRRCPRVPADRVEFCHG
jgi:hypothetical protein